MSTVYTEKEFVDIIDRERTRTDRNGREFSLVVFEIAPNENFDSLLQYCSYVLSQRVRCYDLIGRIGNRKLGVLLPDTHEEGARKVAENVCKNIIPASLHPDHIVLSYPSRWNIDEATSAQLEEIVAAPEGRTAAESKQGASVIGGIGALLPYKMPRWKRFMDVLIAVMACVIVSPCMLAIAALIKVVSKGPVLFKQERVGYMGKPFTCYKFRTMKINAGTAVHKDHFSDLMSDDTPMQKLDNADSRIIPGGQLLRKTGLDELPQLFNVIRGEMSLIGPRPCIPYEAQQYLNWQHKRFDSVPGLTGLWQVSGKNKTTFNEMMRFDISYGRRKSVWLDLRILFKTIPAIIEQVTDKKAHCKKVSGQ